MCSCESNIFLSVSVQWYVRPTNPFALWKGKLTLQKMARGKPQATENELQSDWGLLRKLHGLIPSWLQVSRHCKGWGHPRGQERGRAWSGSQSSSQCPSQEQYRQGVDSYVADPLWNLQWSVERELNSRVINFADITQLFNHSWNWVWGVAAGLHGSNDSIQLPKHECLVPFKSPSCVWDSQAASTFSTWLLGALYP